MRVIVSMLVLVLALGLFAGLGQAQTGMSRVRVVHASPDAPSVDILVDGTRPIAGLAFKAISPYASVPAGQRKLSGLSTPVVLSTVACSPFTSLVGSVES